MSDEAKIGEVKFYLKGKTLVLTMDEIKQLKPLLDDLTAPKTPAAPIFISPGPFCTWPNCPYYPPTTIYPTTIWDQTTGSFEVKSSVYDGFKTGSPIEIEDGTVFYSVADDKNEIN